MDFKTAYEHFKDGIASDDERRLVEEELEKYQIISEHLDGEWETAEIIEAPQEDMKKVRKNLRRRSTATVLTCFILAAALILGALGVEKLFWDPEVNTHNIEYTNDLALTLIAYSELFSPSQIVTGFVPERTGFASYTLSVQMWENHNMMDINYRTGSLKFNQLEFPSGFWDYESATVFARSSYPVYTMSENQMQHTRENLERLPEYVLIRGRVSFPEDLTMEQLLEFRDSLGEGYIGWVGIRNAPEDRQCYPLCGMKPFMGGIVWDQVNEYYPYFDLKSTETSAENLETHFKSLLQLSLDQYNSGKGINVGWNMYDNYYEGVLDYVEENGIMTYGCYVVGSPQLFLELLDNCTASQIWIESAWIDVG